MVQCDMASLNLFATFNALFLSAIFNKEENNFSETRFQGEIEGPEIMGLHHRFTLSKCVANAARFPVGLDVAKE